MTLPQRILRELTERLAEFEPPAYGKVNIEISMSYRDAQLGDTQLTAAYTEMIKA